MEMLNIAELSSLRPKRSIYRFAESRWSKYSFSVFFSHICYVSEAYSEPSQPSQMKLYEKTING